jgi:hypothetical protein
VSCCISSAVGKGVSARESAFRAGNEAKLSRDYPRHAEILAFHLRTVVRGRLIADYISAVTSAEPGGGWTPFASNLR